MKMKIKLDPVCYDCINHYYCIMMNSKCIDDSGYSNLDEHILYMEMKKDFGGLKSVFFRHMIL